MSRIELRRKEKNSKTSQVLNNKNKKAVLLMKVGVKRGYGLKKMRIDLATM